LRENSKSRSEDSPGMSDLQSYIQQLNPVISRRNGAQFAKQLAQPIGAGSATAQQFVERIRRANIFGFCESSCSDSNMSGIIAFRLMALISLVDGDYETGNEMPTTSFELLLTYSPFLFSLPARKCGIQPHPRLLLQQRRQHSMDNPSSRKSVQRFASARNHGT
jgi:hypothetical protein